MLLDRYRPKKSGHLEFVEHSVTTPYIFVDNAISAVTGRERFGFPKQLCAFDEGTPPIPWPGSAETYLSVSTWEPSRTGHMLRPFLRIVREPIRGAAAVDLPIGPSVRPRRNPLSPENLLWAAWSAWSEFRVRTSPGPILEFPGAFVEFKDWLRLGLRANVYNLRQFPDPQTEQGADYQDLIRFPMRLAEPPIVRSIPGRFSVLVNRKAVCPVVDRLGLRVVHRERAFGGRESVDMLQVVQPFYAQADVHLDDIERLCWRRLWGGWRDDADEPLPTTHDGEPALYNDYLGPSSSVFLEPRFRNPTIDVKYLLLPANADTVESLVNALLPAEAGLDAQLLRAGHLTAVRLLVSNSRSELGDGELVWLDGPYASVSVPVSFSYRGKRRDAFLMVHDFAQNDFMLQVLRALAPGTTETARIAVPENWLTSADNAKVVRVDSMAIERSAEMVTIEMGQLFDIIRRGGHVASPAETQLVNALWQQIRAIRPLLSFGAIPSPRDPTRGIAPRITLSDIESRTIAGPRDESGRSYVARFPISEVFSIVERLGLTTIGEETLDHGAGARPRRAEIVPILATGEESVQIRLSWMEVLWQGGPS
ncbi:MAG: hypothetical protein U0414_40755 [Polyangiaceae bacterium]